MRMGGIIFARMASKRLPGKALIDISGKLLLDRVFEAAKKIKNIEHVCIATSINSDDDEINNYAIKRGIECFRGDENDVAERALMAAKKYNYTSFARICGDRPFIDPKIYDELILIHKSNETIDITTNVFPRKVPPGLSAEIVKTKSIKKMLSMTKEKFYREHITSFFYDNLDTFNISSISHNEMFKEYRDIKLVVDNRNDLRKVSWIINHKNYDHNSKKIILLAKEWESKNLKNKIKNK